MNSLSYLYYLVGLGSNDFEQKINSNLKIEVLKIRKFEFMHNFDYFVSLCLTHKNLNFELKIVEN